jgi:hypothetical protein
MNSMKSAFVNAGVSVKEHDASANPAAASATAATPAPEPTFTLTESQLRELMALTAARDLGPQAATPAPTGGSRAAESLGATRPESCAAYRLLSVLERVTSKVIVGTRDGVVVPANIYLVDEAGPQALALVAAGCMIAASGAGRISTYFTRLAENAAAKSLDRTVR